MGDISFFIDLLENQPPYKPITISLQNYMDLSQQKDIRIETYCSACQKERTFYQNSFDDTLQPLKRELLKHTPKPGKVIIDPKAVKEPDSADKYDSNFLPFVVYCAHCQEEHFYAIRIDGCSICKVGQYPSFSREQTASLEKYKNLIKKYYVELTTAINVYSQGKGIAAFVYLRRILEHLIDTKYFNLPDANEQADFIEKLKTVEKTEVVIPAELAAIKKQIYSVLSKGIHEYEEDECLDLFDAVFHVVTVILDQELYKKERTEKAIEAKKAIAKKLKKSTEK